MTTSRGSISERVRRALYVLSRGRCYAPDCQEVVIVIDGDNPVFVGEVAHIVAATPGGPRGAETVPNREAFSNLLLLCGRHHKIIDNEHSRRRYPSKELRRWKHLREVAFDAQTLADLDQLGPIGKQLPAMLIESFKNTVAELNASITRLEESGQLAHGAAALLRDAVDQMPYIDPDLNSTAVMLTHFAETMHDLHSSAIMLSNFAETVRGHQLEEAGHNLERFAQQIDLSELDQLTRRLEAATNAEQLMHVIGRVETAAARFPNPKEYQEVSDNIASALPSLRSYATEPEVDYAEVRSSSDWRRTAKRFFVTLASGLLIGGVASAYVVQSAASAAEQDRQACTGARAPKDFKVSRMVKVSGTPSISPSPYTCATWYPEPIRSRGR